MRGGVDPLLEKVTIVSGDVAEPDLAMSPADRQMIVEKIHIIIHAAATIR